MKKLHGSAIIYDDDLFFLSTADNDFIFSIFFNFYILLISFYTVNCMPCFHFVERVHFITSCCSIW